MRIYKIWYVKLIILCFIRNKKVKPQKNPNVVDYQIFVYLQLCMVSDFPQPFFHSSPKIESNSCEKELAAVEETANMALTVIAVLIVLGCVLCYCVLVFLQTDNYVFLWKFFINKKRIIVVEG